ncbi:MAG: guanylate kinase [Bacteroidales bacterium]|nr:guanylate kinase [Bacteroidales bacterium]
MKEGKIVIFSAPSGSGKSTIVNYLLTRNLGLEFSVSATSRAPRGQEQNGIEYYFLTPDEFRRRIANGDFVEHEEVYEGCFYGTLRSEIDRIWAKGNTIVFDVDVKGGLNLKKIFGDKAMTIFIQPPSIDELRRRLVSRGTDSPEKIEQRLAKAGQELEYAANFDHVVINDDLHTAQAQAESLIINFIGK